jgi:hypothetical protein
MYQQSDNYIKIKNVTQTKREHKTSKRKWRYDGHPIIISSNQLYIIELNRE